MPLRRRRTIRPDVNWQALPKGEGIVAIYAGSDADPVELGELAVHLRDALVAAKRSDLLVVIVPPGIRGIEALDRSDMALHGWVRRQDRQTGG